MEPWYGQTPSPGTVQYMIVGPDGVKVNVKELVEGGYWTNMGPSSDDESSELQIEINRLAERLGVSPMTVGLRTNDDLNIFVDEDGTYHFTYYERGKLGFDRAGSLDDVLYWYCEDIVSSQASKYVGDRRNASSTSTRY